MVAGNVMRSQRIVIQELDAILDYREVKAEIEAKYRTKQVPKMDKLKEKMLEEQPRKYVPHTIYKSINMLINEEELLLGKFLRNKQKHGFQELRFQLNG